MKKSVIALAVAGILAPVVAQAQSSVTIYGVADVGLYSASVAQASATGNVTRTGLQSGIASGSRLGFRGTEDLGGGLKAVFAMEQRVEFDNGGNDNTSFTATKASSTGGNQFDRQIFAGLQSDNFGTFTMGRQYTPTFDVLVKVDAFDYGTSGSFSTAGYFSGATRASNSFKYVTPNKLGGFGASLLYVQSGSGLNSANTPNFDERQATAAAIAATASGGATGAKRGDGVVSFNLRYENGPLFVGAAHTQAKYDSGSDQRRYVSAGATYDFGVVKPYLAYHSIRDKTSPSSRDDNFWHLGARIPFGGSHLVTVSYVRYNDKTATDGDAKHWGVGYNYAFSKRTDLYAAYSHISNKTGGTSGFGGAGFRDTNLASGTSGNAYNIGLRHKF